MCELDIIFNFEKAYFILDELLVGGYIQETSKKNVLKAIAAQDLVQEVSLFVFSSFASPLSASSSLLFLHSKFLSCKSVLLFFSRTNVSSLFSMILD